MTSSQWVRLLLSGRNGRCVLVGGILALAAVFPAARAQFISITGTGTYTQDFDALGVATQAWTDDSTLAGWYAGINANNTPDGNLTFSDGSSAALTGLLNLGAADALDRALGSKVTGGGGFANIAFGVLFRNDSTLALDVTNIGYTGELWRSNDSSPGIAEQWATFYKISSDSFSDVEPGGPAPTAINGTFTAISSLNWSSPNSPAGGVQLDGNAAGNQAVRSTDPNLVINPGQYFMFRWVDTNLMGVDGHQAIDDFSISFNAVPVIQTLTYNAGHAVGDAPNGALEVSPALYWLNGATPSAFAAGDHIVFSQAGSPVISVPASVATGSITVSNPSGVYTLNVASGAVLTAGSLNGGNPIIKAGTGALAFVANAPSTATGGLTIQSGKVSAETDTAIGGLTQSITLDGGELEFTNAAADVTFSDGTTRARTINVTANGGTISGTVGANGGVSVGLVIGRPDSIIGGGTIVKSGPSALRLAANQSTMTGNWIVNGGTLEYGVSLASAFGSGTVTVNAGGRLAGRGATAPATTVVPNPIILNGGELGVRTSDTVIYAGNVDVAANSTASLRSFSTSINSQGFTISGVLSGAADLTLSGVSPQSNGANKALVLTNTANTFTGTFRVSPGQILTSAAAGGTGSTLNSAPVTLNNATLRIRDNGAGSSGTLLYGSDIIVETGDGTIDLDRASGLNADNLVQFGAFTLGAQALTINGANGYGAIFTEPSTLLGDATLAGSGNVFISAGISGAFGLTKSSTSRLTLNGVNTFTGALTVTGGALGGNGSVAGALVNTTTTLSPGNPGQAGIFGVGTDLSFGSTATFSLTIAHGVGTAPAPGTDYDQVTVGTGGAGPSTGSVTLSGTLLLNVGAGVQQGDLFFIILNDGNDPVAGEFNGLSDGAFVTAGGLTFQVSYDADAALGTFNGGNDVALVAIPEPGSAMLLLIGAGGWLMRRPRRA